MALGEGEKGKTNFKIGCILNIVYGGGIDAQCPI